MQILNDINVFMSHINMVIKFIISIYNDISLSQMQILNDISQIILVVYKSSIKVKQSKIRYNLYK